MVSEVVRVVIQIDGVVIAGQVVLCAALVCL